MKKNLLIGLLVFLAFLLTTYLASGQILSTLARYEIEKIESEELKISFSNINLVGLSKPQIEIKDLAIKVGKKEFSHWSFSVPSIRILTDWKAWTSNSYNIQEIEVLGAVVELSEKNDPPDSKGQTNLQGIPFFRVGSIKLKDAKFNYLNLDPKEKRPPGKLSFHSINGEILSFNREAVQSGTLAAKATGYFGKGELKLDLESTLLKKPLEVKMKSEMTEIDLGEINTYLQTTEGLNLKGKLKRAKSSSLLQSSLVETRVQMFYSGLEVEVLDNEKRSSITAGLAEPILQGMICNTNENRGGFSQVHVSKRKRKADESVVQFLLLGLLKVSLNVACLGDIVSP